ncbi:hypothetical protein TRFO_05349 [Tritrichomonas foetus]|uniref:F5/8 type C domain-containing protein n=1 Tax=Tritrichomonas foetus TaxID=1144522 RepID=A0A1J4K7D9_9EUKA|nr:hypothetical protein TRFO_05349 [Tritrichomonas foetus]|eukprot:OHT07115.1 hypothetical protein TRFO_05349 [Tritrichomonas foetus]
MISTSINNFWNAQINETNNFTFIFGSNTVKCGTFSADYISPFVSKMRQADPTIDTFFASKEGKLADIFQSLITNLKLTITEKNIKNVFHLAKYLGNTELLSQINIMVDCKITIENGISILKEQEILNHSKLNDTIKFVASHFCDFDRDSLLSLGIDMLSLILSSPSLRLVNEDQLYVFVSKAIEKNQIFSSLLEYVHFEFLNDENCDDYLMNVSLDNINKVMWQGIVKKFMNPNDIPYSNNNSRFIKQEFIEIPPSYTNDFDGIFNYLNKKCNDNCLFRGLVKVTSSTRGKGSIENIVSKDHTNFWTSANKEDNYIAFNFAPLKVSINAYSLLTFDYGPNDFHMKSWILEGSNNNDKWTKIDLVVNDEYLNGPRKFHTYVVSKESIPFTYIRLKLYGPNHFGSYFMAIKGFELFGKIYQ